MIPRLRLPTGEQTGQKSLEGFASNSSDVEQIFRGSNGSLFRLEHEVFGRVIAKVITQLSDLAQKIDLLHDTGISHLDPNLGTYLIDSYVIAERKKRV